MNTDFDDAVRDSMMWFTDGADIPAGLAAQARRQVRRRRARMSWLAAGTAVTAAAAVLASSALAASGTAPHHLAKGGARNGGPARTVTIQTTAVVVSKVERALARATAGHPVAFTSQTNRGIRLFVSIPHGRPVEVKGSILTWSRGPLQQMAVVTRAGKTVFSTETDLRSGKSVQTMVSYPQRVWWRGTYQAPATTRPKPACTLGAIDRTPAQWTREVRKLLSCGAAVAGFQRVDGVRAIRLRLSSSYKDSCVASNDQRQCKPQPVGWTGILWANAATYLPVRLASHGQHYSFLIDFRWLTPDAANLARLHQQIPAGFRRV
jgi:hypothetical protein